jgi:choice-of-anchor A domain-containing protein
VPPATAVSEATDPAFAAPYSCPPSWPALHAGPPSGAFDGNVSVLVGGNLTVTGAAAGAEGTVVALGDATFARDVPGSYELGATALGSQVTPYAGSDMLVVGGSLAGAQGTHIDVGQGLGGDVVVGGAVAPGTDLDAHGGRLDPGIADATVPYVDLAGALAAKSAGYAALAPTGTVDVTGDTVTMTGDGVSNLQVFTVDGSTLGAGGDVDRNNGQDHNRGQGTGRAAGRDGEGPFGRSLQLTGVPDGATVVVNLTGPAVDLDIDSLLTADGQPLDPQNDPAFGGLATRMLWNAPSATAVTVSGQAQLPGSLLVPTAPSTTTLSGQGTNGRIMVAGNLVHTGSGELHAYPFLPDLQLACGGDPVHLTTLTLDVVVVDPDKVVDPDRYFQGRYNCTLGGADVTPADNTWRLRAGAVPRALSNQIPSGASCTVTERLEGAPAPFRSWADPSYAPDLVVVAKREQKGFVITNKVKDLPPAPTETPTPTSNPTPSEAPTQAAPPPPPPPSSTPVSTPSPTPSTLVEPTNRPTLPSSPTAAPTAAPVSSATPTSSADAPEAGGHDNRGPAGPLATTAPFTLRGAFVWGPLLMLSLLTLLLRVKRRPRRQH